MRRFLKAKVTLVVLALLAIVLVSGVAWASGVRAPWPQVEKQTPQIVVMPTVVAAGTPALTVYGSGFIPNESIILILKTGSGPGDLIIVNRGTGIRVNGTRAFEFSTDELNSEVGPGVYTLSAKGTAGSDTATYPLVVTASK